MHIRTTQASALGNALAAAQDAETAMSLRRARELRETAARLKAMSFETGFDISSELQIDSETAAQTVSMITAWSGGDSSAARSGLSTLDQPDLGTSIAGGSARFQSNQQVQRSAPSGPVSYWV